MNAPSASSKTQLSRPRTCMHKKAKDKNYFLDDLDLVQLVTNFPSFFMGDNKCFTEFTTDRIEPITFQELTAYLSSLQGMECEKNDGGYANSGSDDNQSIYISSDTDLNYVYLSTLNACKHIFRTIDNALNKITLSEIINQGFLLQNEKHQLKIRINNTQTVNLAIIRNGKLHCLKVKNKNLISDLQESQGLETAIAYSNVFVRKGRHSDTYKFASTFLPQQSLMKVQERKYYWSLKQLKLLVLLKMNKSRRQKLEKDCDGDDEDSVPILLSEGKQFLRCMQCGVYRLIKGIFLQQDDDCFVCEMEGKTCIQNSEQCTSVLGKRRRGGRDEYPSCGVLKPPAKRSIERSLKKEKIRLRRQQEKKIKTIYRTYTKVIRTIQRKIKYFEDEASMLSSLLNGNGVLPKPKCQDTSDEQKFLEDLACLDEVFALYKNDTFDLGTIFQGMYSDFFNDVQYVVSA